MKNIIWLIMVLFGMLPSIVFSHPHIFIESSVSVVMDKDGLLGIRTNWVFDEMFSSVIYEEYDKNKDKRFNAQETKLIQSTAFSNLKGYNYFSSISIDNKPFPVTYVKDFSVKPAGEKVVYQFFIPCSVKAIKEYKEVRLAMYDSTYYMDIRFSGKSAGVENVGTYEVQQKMSENPKLAYWDGLMVPQEIVYKFRSKK
ncbi:MAG: hypothetical protein DKM50_08845 [Candidatus Margulisiibacteriota bacterium]|nr:MAG: hypothetical protein A2X43_04425 [Candidatus Margulisbacteria bacterium GWD2_39_127]OGI04137.1 MAG: hypothetical protein A2X42_04740 [Candidatus Margulisbacteria bacterium GWF2_38_17]OGI05988.1 MAG: hypothetical protein A2X41_12250 [Candidatus Margulisbacteria bacterium GWE2_39_32]PZM79556.1 MAG: hypothetical protein DKM50_08845 [Candidatus Margulisiibacteriota bacterium]HAR63392.1 hypothetical protein [Candidatus Margulisiibacteriota bacterium]